MLFGGRDKEGKTASLRGNISSSCSSGASSCSDADEDDNDEDDNDDDDDDKEEFYDAGEGNRASGGEEALLQDAMLLDTGSHGPQKAHAEAARRPLGPGDHAAGVLGHQRLDSRPLFKFSSDQCDNEILDLPLPLAPIALHGPQLFGNEGIAQPDIVLQSSPKCSIPVWGLV